MANRATLPPRGAQTSEFLNVTAAVLAGGLGTRLRSVIADRPKALAEIKGRPFITYLLDQLTWTGVRSAVLCTGYLGEQIAGAIGENWDGLRVSYSREERPLGTGGALRLALPHLGSDPVLVLNGDSFCMADLKGFWNWYHSRPAIVGMLLIQAADTQRYGRVRVESDGAITEFAEKKVDGGPGWINAGIYLLNREVISSIPTETNVSLEHDVFPRLVGRGLCGFPSRGRFLDIGTPEDFAAAETFFASLRM